MGLPDIHLGETIVCDIYLVSRTRLDNSGCGKSNTEECLMPRIKKAKPYRKKYKKGQLKKIFKPYTYGKKKK